MTPFVEKGAFGGAMQEIVKDQFHENRSPLPAVNVHSSQPNLLSLTQTVSTDMHLATSMAAAAIGIGEEE